MDTVKNTGEQSKTVVPPTIVLKDIIDVDPFDLAKVGDICRNKETKKVVLDPENGGDSLTMDNETSNRFDEWYHSSDCTQETSDLTNNSDTIQNLKSCEELENNEQWQKVNKKIQFLIDCQNGGLASTSTDQETTIFNDTRMDLGDNCLETQDNLTTKSDITQEDLHIEPSQHLENREEWPKMEMHTDFQDERLSPNHELMNAEGKNKLYRDLLEANYERQHAANLLLVDKLAKARQRSQLTFGAPSKNANPETHFDSDFQNEELAFTSEDEEVTVIETHKLAKDILIDDSIQQNSEQSQMPNTDTDFSNNLQDKMLADLSDTEETVLEDGWDRDKLEAALQEPAYLASKAYEFIQQCRDAVMENDQLLVDIEDERRAILSISENHNATVVEENRLHHDLVDVNVDWIPQSDGDDLSTVSGITENLEASEDSKLLEQYQTTKTDILIDFQSEGLSVTSTDNELMHVGDNSLYHDLLDVDFVQPLGDFIITDTTHIIEDAENIENSEQCQMPNTEIDFLNNFLDKMLANSADTEVMIVPDDRLDQDSLGVDVDCSQELSETNHLGTAKNLDVAEDVENNVQYRNLHTETESHFLNQFAGEELSSTSPDSHAMIVEDGGLNQHSLGDICTQEIDEDETNKSDITQSLNVTEDVENNVQCKNLHTEIHFNQSHDEELSITSTETELMIVEDGKLDLDFLDVECIQEIGDTNTLETTQNLRTQNLHTEIHADDYCQDERLSITTTAYDAMSVENGRLDQDSLVDECIQKMDDSINKSGSTQNLDLVEEIENEQSQSANIQLHFVNDLQTESVVYLSADPFVMTVDDNKLSDPILVNKSEQELADVDVANESCTNQTLVSVDEIDNIEECQRIENSKMNFLDDLQAESVVNLSADSAVSIGYMVEDNNLGERILVDKSEQELNGTTNELCTTQNLVSIEEIENSEQSQTENSEIHYVNDLQTESVVNISADPVVSIVEDNSSGEHILVDKSAQELSGATNELCTTQNLVSIEEIANNEHYQNLNSEMEFLVDSPDEVLENISTDHEVIVVEDDNLDLKSLDDNPTLKEICSLKVISLFSKDVIDENEADTTSFSEQEQDVISNVQAIEPLNENGIDLIYTKQIVPDVLPNVAECSSYESTPPNESDNNNISTLMKHSKSTGNVQKSGSLSELMKSGQIIHKASWNESTSVSSEQNSIESFSYNIDDVEVITPTPSKLKIEVENMFFEESESDLNDKYAKMCAGMNDDNNNTTYFQPSKLELHENFELQKFEDNPADSINNNAKESPPKGFFSKLRNWLFIFASIFRRKRD